MEEDINSFILDRFDISPEDIRTYSPLALAYIGDCIYEMVIRTVVVAKGNLSVSKLHKESSFYAKASSQARIAEHLKEELSDEEKDVLRRGRNAKSYTHAKNASIADYRLATGLEALVGFLYLKGRFDRIVYLIKTGMHCIKE